MIEDVIDRADMEKSINSNARVIDGEDRGGKKRVGRL